MECVKVFLSFLDLFKNEKNEEDQWIFKYGDMVVNSILVQGYVSSVSVQNDTICIDDGTSAMSLSKDSLPEQISFNVGDYLLLRVSLEKDENNHFTASIVHSINFSNKPNREALWVYEVFHAHYKIYKKLTNLNMDTVLKDVKDNKMKIIEPDTNYIEITDDSITVENIKKEDIDHDQNIIDTNELNDQIFEEEGEHFIIDDDDLDIEYEILQEDENLKKNTTTTTTATTTAISLDDDDDGAYVDLNETSRYEELTFELNDDDYHTIHNNNNNNNDDDQGPKDKDLIQDDYGDSSGEDSWN
ncbi:hypothetical protein DICPUDRAFT_78710 [Dictyostelium purpureum]|uniref:Uncharacterized protein n=1 Tax=Dictyostelium purpureum TaxID=5786 RepID=F0ZKB7_DICPU|nr:uncharacterized protein DICPUDRAFT_78710 [Dictyostelium purpureum]EGC35629.1 hypothetical protein DICPUDRAFT_78710 [Dictyostelium purpureum]|eukprot:XP_003287866.1 hypothetical protein DICPUDRAFT_78710 [Dictyostelium purpureum]